MRPHWGALGLALLLGGAGAALPYGVQSVRLPGSGNCPLTVTVTTPVGRRASDSVLLLADFARVPRREIAVLIDKLTRADVSVVCLDMSAHDTTGGAPAAETLEMRAEDAADALAWARQRHEGATGVMGLGDGALLAPLVAEGAGGAGFLVLFDPPTRPAAAAELARATTLLGDATLARSVLEKARGDNNGSARPELIRMLVSAGFDAAHAAALATSLTAPAYRSFVDYDPAPALRAWRGPALVVAPRGDAAALRTEMSQNPSAEIHPAMSPDAIVAWLHAVRAGKG